LKSPALRTNSGWLPLLVLSVLPTVLPDADWVSILRGESRLDAEIRQTQVRGYYEAILADSENSGAVTGRGGKLAAENSQKAPPGWRPFAESGIVEPVDGYLRWRMKPNLQTVWNGARFTTNSLGYRTPDVAIPKPRGTYRIVVLGSSNTMGHGVSDDEMFVRLLEAWLNGDEADVGRRVEVVNLAVSSDSPSQNLLRLQTDVPALEPDWILIDVTVLDYSLEELHLHTSVRDQRSIPFGYIRTILRNAEVSPSDSFTEFSVKMRGSTEALLDGAYAGWASQAAELDTPATLIQLPRTDAQIKNRNLERMAARLAKRYSLPMIDLTDAYRGRKLSEYRLSPWDKHPSVLGHQLIFEELRDELIERGGGPCLPLGVELSRGDGKAENASINPA
jgi:lysophospholipase L1-like esterase